LAARFIGRAAEELAAAGDEPSAGIAASSNDAYAGDHLHCDRSELGQHRKELAASDRAVVDCRALTRVDAEALGAAGTRRWIVISSVDVYRAFGALNAEQETDPVPIDEDSSVRPDCCPYRGKMPGMDDDKLDVEDIYLPRGATVLRLPMVYGEHDYQRREEFILRRVRAGRKKIPFGSGQWLACRVYVRDVGRAVRLALQKDVAGEVFNICEDRTYSMRMWSQAILDAAGSEAELVRVRDDALPEDLKFTGTMTQHIAASGKKARAMLGWETSDPLESLRTTVRWHLAHPPDDATAGFDADDLALATL
jgi:nucleoside-diphosphate-sugar epimerase